ncbi:MAG: AbrB/MazE/SpoVT family DNA-binding domain-containing protein [Verrucomicrobia bacterium]|nr:AbrB/MazE/SpoVT family DNA-binding domain-containing protein [Verrucomicrobiota bacterium]
MKATLTSKGQITIPKRIREMLGLETGQVMEFDEAAPFLKATPVFDEDQMWTVVGCADGKQKMNSARWLKETRGEVALPPKSL